MSITRAQAESILIRRRGRQLTLVGLDGATQDGTNPDLSDPLACALGALSIYPGDPTSPTDSDLSAVAPESLAQFLDIAELKTLEVIVGNWTEWDEQSGTDRQSLGAFGAQLQAALESLRARCESLYGFGVMPLAVGILCGNSQERLCDP